MFSSLHLEVCMASTKIVALGDIEGDFKRLEHFLLNSDAFIQNADESWVVKEGYHFVFLGDAVDKADGNIRVVRTLSQLKESNPKNVSLILGNRDTSKLSMVQHMYMDFDDVYSTLENSYKKILLQENLVSSEDLNDKVIFKSLARKFDNPEIRLKALFSICNAPNGFEYLLKELIFLYPSKNITNNFVVDYFLKSVSPGGELYDYLLKGQMMAQIDNNLFVHGAISNDSFGFIPGRRKKLTDVKLWMTELNRWQRNEILSWGRDVTSGDKLIAYGFPKSNSVNNVSSVIYNRFSDKTGNVKAPDYKVRKALSESGINRIVVGHTPVKDIPFVASFEEFEVVLTDVSDSSYQNRSFINIEKNIVKVRTTLENGKVIVANVQRKHKLLPDGEVTKNGYRILGKQLSSEKYVLMKVSGSGRNFKNKYIYKTLDEIFDIGLKTSLSSGKCETLFFKR